MRTTFIALALLTFSVAAMSEEPSDASALPPGAILRLGTTRFRAPQFVDNVIFSPDGKLLAGTVFAGGLVLWDAETGTVRRKFESNCRSVCFSPDGSKIAVTGILDGEIWDFSSGNVLVRFPTDNAEVMDVAWSPDGKMISVGDCGENLFIRDPATGKEILHLKCKWSSEGLATWSSDSRRLGGLGPAGEAAVFEIPSGKVLASVAKKDDFDSDTDISPDGQLLVRGNNKEGCLVWDVKAGKRREDLEKAIGDAHQFAFSRNGAHLAMVGGGRLRVLDVASCKMIFDAGEGNDGWKVAFSPDGSRVAISAGSGARIWELQNGKEIESGPSSTAMMGSMEWMPDGEHLLTEGRGNDAVLWNISDGSTHVLPGSRSFLSLSDDGDLLVERKGQDNFRVWSLSTGKELLERKCPNSWYQEIKFLPGTHQIAIAHGAAYELVDCDSGKSTGDIKAGAGFSNVDLLLSKSRYVTISYDTTQVWETTTKRKLSEVLAQGEERTSAGDLSSDGTLLLLRRGEKRVELHVAETGETVWSLDDDSTPSLIMGVTIVRFSPDGRFIMLLAENGYSYCKYWVRLVETASGKEVRSIQPPSPVSSFRFSPDGRLVALGMQDSTVLLYTLEPPDLSENAKLEALLADLPNEDAGKGWRAAWTIAKFHKDAVPAMQEAISRVPDSAAAKSLLAALDADDVGRRDTAATELNKLGLAAEPALVAALQENLSAEARGRVNAILAKIRGPGDTDPDSLRISRGIAVLEQIATDEARAALKSIAEKHFSAKGRACASAALERMTKGH